MLLFLDRFPFHCWIDQTQSPPREFWTVVLPVVLTEANAVAAPPSAAVQLWMLDTGTRGEAFAWRQHLVDAGLDPDVERLAPVHVITTVSGKQLVAVRKSSLWLISNVPGFPNPAWRLEVDPGLPFRDVPTLPDPQYNRPLIGMNPLRRAGLKVEIDFGNDNVSVWVPDPSATTTQP